MVTLSHRSQALMHPLAIIVILLLILAADHHFSQGSG